jgi:hypothetical protein
MFWRPSGIMIDGAFVSGVVIGPRSDEMTDPGFHYIPATRFWGTYWSHWDGKRECFGNVSYRGHYYEMLGSCGKLSDFL